MAASDFVLPNEVLDRLTKKILWNLVTVMAKKYLNKGISLDGFFEDHSDLYKTAEKKRKPKFKRKRVLIFTPSVLNTDLIRKAVAKLNRRNLRFPNILSPGQVEVVCLKDKDPAWEKLEGSSEYSDVIFVSKGKKGDDHRIGEALKEMKGTPYFYPYVVEDNKKNSGEDSLEEAMAKTLLYAFRTNDDKKSALWQVYAMIDNLYSLLKSQVYDANRMGEMQGIYNRYAVIKRPDELPYFSDSKILVLGASVLSADDLKKEVNQSGLSSDRFEFRLEFKKASYNLDKYKGNVNYAAICLGPLPHKMPGIDAASSAIAKVKNHPELYPKLFEIRNNAGELKITRSSFKDVLDKLERIL